MTQAAACRSIKTTGSGGDPEHCNAPFVEAMHLLFFALENP